MTVFFVLTLPFVLRPVADRLGHVSLLGTSHPCFWTDTNPSFCEHTDTTNTDKGEYRWKDPSVQRSKTTLVVEKNRPYSPWFFSFENGCHSVLLIFPLSGTPLSHLYHLRSVLKIPPLGPHS